MAPKHFMLILLCLSMGQYSEAQILKKLRKKVEKVVTKKDKKRDSIVQDQAYQDSIAMVKLQEGFFAKLLKIGKENNDMANMGKPIAPPTDNNVKLPESYKFSYQATIHVKSNNKTAEVEYLLQPNETYYAKKQTKNGFTEHIVYDNGRSIEVYYAEIQGKKRQARKKMGILTKARILGAYKDAPDKQVKPLGSKKLLGFNCEGYEITTEAGTTQFWVTNEAPASLYATMFEKRAEAPNSPFTKNTMVMEVTFYSSETSDKNYQMVCTQLQPKNRVFNKADYIE